MARSTLVGGSGNGRNAIRMAMAAPLSLIWPNNPYWPVFETNL
jgi:hypothetical protein